MKYLVEVLWDLFGPLEVEWLGKENNGEEEMTLTERFEIIDTPTIFE